MAIASAKARPMISGRNSVPVASGLRPMASIALATPRPTPMPGPIAPSPMASPAASGVISGMVIPPPRCVRVLVGCAVLLFLAAVVRRGQRQEGQREHSEDQGLHDADEQLEPHEQ